MTMTITIINTGAANVASVRAAIERAGCATRTTESPEDVVIATAVVVPGVGAFGTAMQRLRELGLDAALRERIAASSPTLGVCLGMQLLLDGSEESPGVAGLSIVPGQATRFPNSVRVPQMGWNTVRTCPNGPAWPWPSRADGNGTDAYFANSFRLSAAPELLPTWSTLISEYAGSFIAAIARGPILACQFHPELSGAFGDALIQSWLRFVYEPIDNAPQSRALGAVQC